MKLYEPAWCPRCQLHLVDPANHRGTCPVCLDRQSKDARAAAALMGWRVAGGAA